jgi:hypothetical protein
MKKMISKYVLFLGVLLIGLLALTACGKTNENVELTDTVTNASTSNVPSPRPTLDDVDKKPTVDSVEEITIDEKPTPTTQSQTLYVHAISARATRSGDRWLVNTFYYDVTQTPLSATDLEKLTLTLSSMGRTSQATYNPQLNCSQHIELIKQRKSSFGYDFQTNSLCVSPNFDMGARQVLQTSFMSDAFTYTINATTPSSISQINVGMAIQR